MGACAQIAVFTYAVMRRTPRYEIGLAAPFADNLMNSVAHCGELPINVERPLQHIYELSAWLVTKDCHKTDELPEHAFWKAFKKPVATAGYKNKQTVSRRRYLARVLWPLMYRYG